MNKLKFISHDKNHEVYFEFQEFASNGATAVLALYTASYPYTRVSANFKHVPILQRGHFYLRDWSENIAIAKAMIDEKLIEPLEGISPVYSGYIVAHAYQFTKEGLNYVENAMEFLQEKYPMW